MVHTSDQVGATRRKVSDPFQLIHVSVSVCVCVCVCVCADLLDLLGVPDGHDDGVRGAQAVQALRRAEGVRRVLTPTTTTTADNERRRR
jgi:hypothetical protein